ncbi:cytochrome c oxidase assembly factor 4 homolog, mitochondrial [Xenopus laevis]|uniref:Cytochrome c oxidase assembly factor 4 homolog, mitochondrial n=2 Tax=Xenopus laevis TaxID=8355 RepID=A0A8J1L060_XENLA|nr:cytochrome c oxidase assembly factor 4 homolog, mitochondrial [Xenopus laevis]XP_041422941.1 cytochrome c oxidase assembly factor 4 homolog, mitochondrial [Xenopus laevis]
MSSPTPQPHNRSRKADDEEDPLEHMIGRTGCAWAHYAVQECMAEQQDWRKCQTHVQSFKDCMQAYQQQRAAQLHKLRHSSSSST